MIQSLLSQHSSLQQLLASCENLINETYRQSIKFKIGDEVVLNGNRGVIAEITYFRPMKVLMYRKDGELSKSHRLVKSLNEISMP
jgi:hypothetical protein